MREVHGWRRVVRWLIGIAGGVLVLVTAALVVGFIVLQTGWGRGVLRDQIQARVDNAFAGGASIGGVEGNPFSDLVLTDVVINGPDKQPAITVKRLTVTLPLLPLLSHQLRVESIIAEELDVRVQKLANGELNVTHLLKPSKPSTWSVALPNVEVRRGHVRLEGVVGEEPIDIDDLEVDFDAALPFAGPVAANVRVTGAWRQKEIPLSAGAMLRGDRDELELRNAAIQAGDIRVLALGVKVPKTTFEKPFAGTIAVQAPARALRDLVPSVALPGDVSLAVTARPEGRLTYFNAFGSVGRSAVAVYGRADVQAKLATGVVLASDLALGELTDGAVIGSAGGVAALQLDASARGELPAVAGMITAWSSLRDVPPVLALVSIDSRGDQIRATIGASSTTGIRVAAGGSIRRLGKTLVLEHADVIANTVDVMRATSGKAPLRGALTANLHVAGTLVPRPELSIVGHANGRNLAALGVRADRLALSIDAANVPARPAGRGRIELTGLARGDLALGKLTISARNRRDGKLHVSVRSEPKLSRAPSRVEADALIALGDTYVVELQRHLVRVAGGATWTGNAGRLTIGAREVELHGLRSASQTGTVRADGMYVRAGRGRGDFRARVDTSIALGNIDKKHEGRVEAHVDIARTRDHIAGTVVAKGRGISLDPCAPTFDADLAIETRARQLIATLGVSTAKSGSAKFALDVDAPNDITDLRAWRKLDHSAIRTAQLALDEVKLGDLAQVIGHPMTGRVDGQLELAPAKAGGTLQIRGAGIEQITPLGTIDADLAVAPVDSDAVKATVTAHLVPSAAAEAAKDATSDGAARLYAEATFETPDRIFDPSAWKQLGPDAFRGGTFRAERFAFQPGTLERLGIVSKLRGELAAGAQIEPGMEAVQFSVNVHGLRSGAFAQPVALELVGAIDDRSTRVKADARMQGITLVHVESEVPLTLEQLRLDPRRAMTAPLGAHARIEQVPLKTLMDAFGATQVTGGTLDGTIDVAGTVSRPTLAAKIVARGVAVPSEATQQVQHINELTLAGTWDGAAANVTVDAEQSAGGTLKLRAAGSPSDLDRVIVSLSASKLDLAPLVAFMPAPIGGIGGRIDANVELRGANPETAQVAGSLSVTNGRIPIAPTVGTVFKANGRVDIKNRHLDLRMTGKLGRGDVALTASAPLDGLVPNTGTARLELENVRLIGVHEPIITGVADGTINRIGFVWHATVKLDKVTVRLPEDRGEGLAPVGAPDDMVFGGVRRHHGSVEGVELPGIAVTDRGEGPQVDRDAEPAIVAHIEMRNAYVESEEMRGLVSGKLAVTVGKRAELGMVGELSLARGVFELFSRRYEVDKAILHYDGSLDPLLDIRITHDFPDVTTITEVRGRLSRPKLTMTSDPAQYSQAELLGFLLGGEPGGDPARAPTPSERVVGAGASLISARVSGLVRKALPVDIDVLRYEAESSTSSAAVTVGTWITDTLFLAYRRRLEARPDENTGEGEVEWWIRRRLFIQGVLGDRNINGADLLWRRRW